MANIKSSVIAALATVGLALSTAAALADVPAVATSAVNVRSGPGTSFGIMGQLSKGQNVSIIEQQGSWCFVDAHVDGWVACSFLTAGGGGGGGGSPEVPFNFGVTVGPGGPSFSFGIGDAPPPPPPVFSRVCFYKNAGYTGSEWCVNSGTNVNNINFGGWNDNISSLRVQGGASVQVCRNINYGGSCALFGGDQPNLNFVYNNQISSLKVF